MSNEEDPEVVADLKLRAYTERDRSRTRGDGAYTWVPPVAVTRWKCRTPPCKTFIDVPEDALVAWGVWNRRLASHGDSHGNRQPIASHEVMRCDSCAAEYAKVQPARLRKRADRTADVIRQLKAGDKVIRFKDNDGDHGANEAEAFQQLRKWGHPDVDGLIAAIADKRNAAPSKRERRGGM